MHVYFFALATVVSMQPCVRAGGIDAAIAPGPPFEGRIAYDGDEDVVTVDCLAGTKVDVKVKSASAAALKPTLGFYANGVLMNGTAAAELAVGGGGTKKLMKLPITADGTCEIRISGAGLGSYTLKVKEHLPAKATAKKALVSGQSHTLAFPARSGAAAFIVLKTPADGPGLALPDVLDPAGAPLALDGLVAVKKGGHRLEIGPMSLPDSGTYRVVVYGTAALPQTVQARVFIEHAEPDIAPIVEPSGHTAVVGSVATGSGAWLDADAEVVADELLIRLAPGADRASIAASLRTRVIANAPNGWSRLAALEPAAVGPVRDRVRIERVRSMVLAARALPGVVAAEPNSIRRSFAIPSDPLWPRQWDMVKAGFPAAYDFTLGSAGGRVAVLDTGVRAEHPDLAGRLIQGYDFVMDSWNAGDGGGPDADPTDPFLTTGTHGTHVSGTVAARWNDGIGMAGGVQQGFVMPVRVLGVLGGTDFDIAQGILYAARLPNSANVLPAEAAAVINMSLGGSSWSGILAEAVADALDAGVVIVAAAGNSNSSKPMYPAALAGVIAVSATDALDQKTYYSSYGPHVALCAPGGDSTKDKNGDGYVDGVLSCVVDPYLGPTWAMKSGTSMAAPHVAAAAFMVRGAAPELSPLEVLAVLAAGAQDLGSAGDDDEYGYGRLDAGAAVAIALGQGPFAAAPFALPSALEFGLYEQELPIAVVNRGGGPMQVLSATSGMFWLNAEIDQATAPCTLRVQVDRTGLPPGSYGTELVLATTAGTLNVPVHVAVGLGANPGPPDSVYVIAIDEVEHKVAAIALVTEATAQSFVLDPLPEGTYRIIASTDADFDGIVGEAGDVKGAYLDPVSGSALLALIDGSTLSPAGIEIAAGSALPGGGDIALSLE